MKIDFLKPIATIMVMSLILMGCGGAPERNAEGAVTADPIYGEVSEGSVDYDMLFSTVDNTENYDIVSLLGREQNFSVFADLLRLSGLDISMFDEVTLMVPTNQAFKAMPEGHLEHLMNPMNREDLSRFVQRHILPREVNAIEFEEMQIIETGVEEEITIETGQEGQLVYIGGASIVRGDIEAQDGVIHVMSGIVEPTADVIAY